MAPFLLPEFYFGTTYKAPVDLSLFLLKLYIILKPCGGDLAPSISDHDVVLDHDVAIVLYRVLNKR